MTDTGRLAVEWEYSPTEQQHIRDANRADDKPDDLVFEVDGGVVTATGTPETIRWLYDFLHHLKRAWRNEGEQWDADASEEMAESLYQQVDGDLPDQQRTKEVMTDGGTEQTGIELVRCTRGHTVKKGSCTAVVGKLVCPICECRIPGHSPNTEIDRGQDHD